MQGPPGRLCAPASSDPAPRGPWERASGARLEVLGTTKEVLGFIEFLASNLDFLGFPIILLGFPGISIRIAIRILSGFLLGSPRKSYFFRL